MVADAEPHVLFDLNGTTYGLPARDVRRLEMVEAVTPVPNAPAYVDGLVFSRGQVVPAVNLRARFGFPRVPYDPRTRLIVVAHGDRTVGLIVDSAREFLAVPAGSIHPPPEAMAPTSGKYLRGVARVDGRVILMLDAAGVITPAAG